MRRFGFLASLFLILIAITSCAKAKVCLDSAGCRDGVDKVCKKDEPNALELCKQTKDFSHTSYLEDFEALKIHISKSYANLEDLLNFYKLDPYELSNQTIMEVKKSKNEKEAVEALKRFVQKFHDGHFQIFEPKHDKNGQVDSDKKAPIAKTISAKQACKLMDFAWEKDYSFKFPIEGVRVKEKGEGEFPYLVVEDGKKVIGILRVSDFRTTVYPKTCVNSWDKYKYKFKQSCDENCQDDFINNVMRSAIVDQFYMSLEKIRATKVDALVLDVTNNGGGTDWVEDITALTTTKPIVCGKSGFVKHPHYMSHFQQMLKEIRSNLPHDKQKIADMQEAIKIASQTCDRTQIWNQKNYKLNCSLVGFRKGEQCKFSELKYKGKKKYNGKLFILANKHTASAAEDIVARHLDSKTAVMIGSRTYGAGCGYMNGGIRFQLPNTRLEVKVPDCVRVRADGTNEVIGIQPDISIDTEKIKESDFLKLVISKVISAL